MGGLNKNSQVFSRECRTLVECLPYVGWKIHLTSIPQLLGVGLVLHPIGIRQIFRLPIKFCFIDKCVKEAEFCDQIQLQFR